MVPTTTTAETMTAAEVEAYRAETARREAAYRYDTHALLGSAAYFIKALAAGDVSETILRGMAQTWIDAYARYGNGERSALDWTARAVQPCPRCEANAEEARLEADERRLGQ